VPKAPLAQAGDCCLTQQAIRQGGVCEIVSLERIAERISDWSSREEKLERLP